MPWRYVIPIYVVSTALVAGYVIRLFVREYQARRASEVADASIPRPEGRDPELGESGVAGHRESPAVATRQELGVVGDRDSSGTGSRIPTIPD